MADYLATWYLANTTPPSHWLHAGTVYRDNPTSNVSGDGGPSGPQADEWAGPISITPRLGVLRILVLRVQRWVSQDEVLATATLMLIDTDTTRH